MNFADFGLIVVDQPDAEFTVLRLDNDLFF